MELAAREDYHLLEIFRKGLRSDKRDDIPRDDGTEAVTGRYTMGQGKGAVVGQA